MRSKKSFSLLTRGTMRDLFQKSDRVHQTNQEKKRRPSRLFAGAERLFRSLFAASLMLQTDFILNREYLPYLLNALHLTGEGAEIGVQCGIFSELLLERWRGRRLYSIDPWKSFPADKYKDKANVTQLKHDVRYQETVQKLCRFGTRSQIVKDTSEEAAGRFADGQLDFVYLDAQHHYEAVKQDINLWYPKIRRGGILAGHDYWDGENQNGNFGVKSAVDEFAFKHNLRLVISRDRQVRERSWCMFVQ